MATFLDLFGFLTVLLRAATLALSAIAIGGVIFSILVNGPAPLNTSSRRLLVTSCFALALTECFCLAANSIILRGTTELTLFEIVGANFFGCGLISLLAAATLGLLASRDLEASRFSLACAAVLLLAEIGTSHAAARITSQGPLLLLTAAHQGATAAWIGGLPYLLLTLRQKTSQEKLLRVARRFSRLSLWSVALLFLAGAGLSCYYIGSAAAIYGTNYGLMVATKIILFCLVLGLGGINFRIIRDLSAGDRTWVARIARIGEAELGIGITVVLAAASLTSQPPGVDLTADRVSIATIVARMRPEPPRLQTPPLSSLSPSTRQAWNKAHPDVASPGSAYVPGQSVPPSSPGDIAWSEYNHHWAGIVVLLAGILAVFSRFRRLGWAKQWPLAFTGLALFILLRADPETWPLGPDGFWESFTSADVAQHRFFVLLILLFAAFEWGVQTGRLKSRAAALVFPGVCAAGGATLFTHTHAISNIQEELLAELTHLPIALLAVVAGWARWLELRYPGPRRQFAAHVWPVCFALIGVGLLLYREA